MIDSGATLESALDRIGMRIFAKRQQQVGMLHHGIGEMGMRIEFGTDHDIRPDDLAHSRQQIAFAVIAAIGHHRTVQAEQDNIDRHGGTQVIEEFGAQGFVRGPGGDAGRHRAGHHAFDQGQAKRLGTQAGGPQRAGKELRLVRMLAGGKITAVAKGGQAGGQGCESIGLGGKRRAEDSHSDPLGSLR